MTRRAGHQSQIFRSKFNNNEIQISEKRAFIKIKRKPILICATSVQSCQCRVGRCYPRRDTKRETSDSSSKKRARERRSSSCARTTPLRITRARARKLQFAVVAICERPQTARFATTRVCTAISCARPPPLSRWKTAVKETARRGEIVEKHKRLCESKFPYSRYHRRRDRIHLLT